jgi:hypothetical protein
VIKKPKAALALHGWLEQHEMTIQEFADAVGTKRGTAATWLLGKRRPIAKRAEIIQAFTKGAVRANEWGDGKQRSWSTADDEDLAEKHAMGWKDARIAEATGRSMTAVRTRRCRLGIVARRWRNSAVSEAPADVLIAELRSRGFVVSQAQAHSGVMSL